MPLPIAHGLVGASAVALIYPGFALRRDWWRLGVGAVLAVAPDFDFFFSMVLHMGGWHRGASHSITLALLLTCLLAALLGRARIREAVAYSAAFMSHGLLDFFATTRGGGVELLWPFSTARFMAGLFSISEFPHGFNRPEILRACVIEAALFLPLLLVVLLARQSLFSSSRKASRP
ncbi:MAG TPA: metal-dependent hydrolase [Pyrinomonadaceae bacterium]|jgi:membrane-bound metal-dependent hydrolase YbcI (DUF457 family)